MVDLTKDKLDLGGEGINNAYDLARDLITVYNFRIYFFKLQVVQTKQVITLFTLMDSSSSQSHLVPNSSSSSSSIDSWLKNSLTSTSETLLCGL